jgi:hypothetical protein
MTGSHELHDGLCWTRLYVALKASDVGSGTKGTSGAGKHDHANRPVDLNVVQGPYDRR